MTIDVFINRIDGLLDYVKSGSFTRDIMVYASMDMVAEIKSRVRETSVLGSGKTYPYSTKTTLVGRSSFTSQSAWDKLFNIKTFTNEWGITGEVSRTLTKSKKPKSFKRWATIEKNGKKYHLIILEGGYAKIRELEGRNNKKKNYSRTGEMWAGFGIKDKKPLLVELGGRTEMSQNKINWNTERDNDVITAPTEKEQQRLTDYVAKKLADVMRNRLTK